METLLATILGLNIATCTMLPEWCPRCAATMMITLKLEEREFDRLWEQFESDHLFVNANPARCDTL